MHQGSGLPSSPWCQRWRSGSTTWRHITEPVAFTPDRYRVAHLDEAAARTFIGQNHYLRSFPAALHRFGMWDRNTSHLVGVAVYSAPVHSGVLQLAFPRLEPYKQSAELGRFVLLDEIPANAESWMLARTFRVLRDHGVRGVVSFADPMPRRSAAGIVVAGHVGTIYQASGALYTGRGTPRTLIMLPDGSILNARSAQKVRRQEQGHSYVEQQLIHHGAAPRKPSEEGRQWLHTALNEIGARRVRHHGPHRYLFPLGATRRDRDLVLTGYSSASYPKTPDPEPDWSLT